VSTTEANSRAADEGAQTAAGLRRWMPWFITGIAVLAFCASLWIAYRSGGPVASGGEAPLIKAEKQPVKVRPSAEGASGEPDPQIYGQIGKQGAAPTPVTTSLAPAPETPVARPQPAENPASASLPLVNVPPAPVPAQAAAPNSARTSNDRERLEMSPQKAPPRHVPASRPAVSLPLPPTPVAPPAPPVPSTQAAKPETAKQAAPTAAKPSAGETAALAEVTPAAGGRLVQLGAYRSEAEAQGIWNRLKANEAPLVGMLKSRVVRADLGEKGVFYRLQAGPLADEAAKGLCRELTARKQACFVVPPG